MGSNSIEWQKIKNQKKKKGKKYKWLKIREKCLLAKVGKRFRVGHYHSKIMEDLRVEYNVT